MTFIPSFTFTDYEWFPWNISNGCGMPAGNAYPFGHLVPSPFVGLACAPIVETRFLELAMSLLDFSPRIPLGTFSIFPNKSLFIFKLLGECHCWWTKESPRAHVAKFYGPTWLIRSVLGASRWYALELIEIVNLWVYYTIPFRFSFFRHFLASLFNFSHYFLWLRITDEGSIPEMRIWSIMLIKSD